MRKSLFGLILSAVALGVVGFTGGFRARVTIEVVDEEGRPVPDIEVGFSLFGPDPVKKGNTDGTGRFTGEGRTLGWVEGGTSSDRFYNTTFSFELHGTVPPGVQVRRRYPDYTHRVVIRPIVNPVPMYAYEWGGFMPGDGEEVGFDFLKAGWVAPHGRGEVADVLVRIKTYDHEQMGRRGGEVSWRFPNPGDGMVRIPPEALHNKSWFRTPRMAPETGYIANWRVVRYGLGEGDEIIAEPPGPDISKTPFFIRIRTELNEKGEITRAMYGRIGAGASTINIGWSPSHLRAPATIRFIYYINPDGTRNMESDPKRNLFREILPPQDRTRYPMWP